MADERKVALAFPAPFGNISSTFSMAKIAQLVEQQIVVLPVAGSSPVFRPILLPSKTSFLLGFFHLLA